jgi:hypothetical protein
VQDADYTDVDAVFCCLPHGTTQQIVRDLPSSVKVVDLSADFRLRDVDTYAEWYGGAHQAVELQKEVRPFTSLTSHNPTPICPVCSLHYTDKVTEQPIHSYYYCGVVANHYHPRTPRGVEQTLERPFGVSLECSI